MELLIVTTEGLIAVAVTSLAWGCRRSGPRVLFPCGVLVGMAWCALLHGVAFGLLGVEGPHAGRDPALLAGFGLVAAIVAGLPLGTVLGLAFGLVARLRERRRAMRLREWADEGPG